MEQKKINKAIATLMIGGMILGTGFISAAAKDTTTTSSVAKTKTTAAAHFKHGQFNMDTQLKTKLDALVTKGTITQAQENNVLAYFKTQSANRQAEFEKIKNMTPEQRQALKKDNTNKPQDSFSELVKAGTITQAQADAIKSSFPTDHKGFRNGKFRGGRFATKGKAGVGGYGMNIKTQLDKLVTSTTITQDQETKIVAYFQNQENAMKTQMEKLKTMTQAERQAFFKDRTSQKTDQFAELVKAGTITQAQADAIKASFKSSNNHARPSKTTQNKSTTK